ncbi:MAG: hypothetical protein Q4E24_16075 [bacterium]|nr:hypothetical protein [bacterium]
MSVFGDSPGAGTGPSSGSSTGGDYPTFNAYGLRITLGTSGPIQEAGISELAASATEADLQQQRLDIANINRTRYWEPGVGGLNIVGGQHKESATFAIYSPTDSTHEKYNYSKCYGKDSGVGQDGNSNIFAWQIYKSGDTSSRPMDSKYQFNQDLHDAIWGIGDYATADLTAQDLKAKFESSTGMNALNKFKEIFAFDKYSITRLNTFSWNTSENMSWAGTGAYEQAYWSQLGHIATCWMLVFAIMDTGNADYWYADALGKMMKWRADGYSADLMPVIVIESTSGLIFTGGTRGTYYTMATVPIITQQVYKNNSPEEFYANWSNLGLTDPQDDIRPAICKISKGAGPANHTISSMIRQGLQGYATGGTWVNMGYRGTSDTSVPYRNYNMLMQAIEKTRLDGWTVAYAYYMKTPPDPGDPDDPGEPGADALGSFTWRLNPNGKIDKTPDETLSATSTITNLNISQNGYNKNNYNDWDIYVHKDTVDKNRIRINVYRVSEDLQKDVPANTWDRNSVLKSGNAVPTSPPFVSITDGTIYGIPVITQLQSGEPSRDLTDAELLEILNTGTGLSYSEVISGQLDPGMKVTYAVTVEVDIGSKNKWYHFSNEQAEWVEYRSEPGVYTYTSDDPDGWAEIKCGYFDSTQYSEPFEAMAGLPTTENLYFVSGGQEFVAQIKYEYTEDKEAIRTFEQQYSQTQCEGYYYSTKAHSGSNELISDVEGKDF